ncbi:phage tail protein [Pantoea agglomerans]|uniref:Phage tail protein n=1 Tax=Enterobacter agglomerans TaxID=549 RepID=A0ACC5RRJ2_ENTAG|nr:phage tail protein [Pantoea agglomerans]MBK4727181.1 phage tail protein [Pantoea agglomerans]
MTTKYYAILTTLGAGKLANAAALGTKLQITHMALGDGGGVLPSPNASQTALIGEKRRAPLNSLSVDAANSSQIIAEQVIPEDEGGWWIREIGLFDADGVLIAVANCAETYKPLLQEGSGRTQTVRMILIVNSTDAVTLKIDPSVVLATRKFVDDSAVAIKVYVDAQKASPVFTGKPTAPTAAKTDNSTQVATTAFVKSVTADYATTASPALSGTPTAPTAAAGNNSQQLANTAFVQAAIAAMVAGAPGALDTLKELADALGGDAHFSTTVLNALAGKMDRAKNGADISNVASFLQNLGLDEGAKLPSMSVSTSGGLLVKIPFFTTSKTVNYLVIQMATVTTGTLSNGQEFSYSFPIAYDLPPWGILSETSAIASGNASDEGMDILTITATGLTVRSNWNSRPDSYGPIRLLIMGVKANA